MYFCFEYWHAEINFKSPIFFLVFVKIFPAQAMLRLYMIYDEGWNVGRNVP